MKNTILMIIVASILSCTTVPITSIPKLSKIEGRDTDPSQLRAIAQISNGIDIQSAEIQYSVWADLFERVELVSVLELIENEADATALMAANQNDGMKFQAYKLSDLDIKRATQLQNRIKAWSLETGERAHGGFTLNVHNFCYFDAHKDGKLYGNLWVKTEETGEYVKLFQNLDLSFDEVLKNELDREKIICVQ